MTDKNFTHLHVHTEFSLLDGAARIPELLDRAKELNFTSLAVTDHGVMYGAVNFYKEATRRGIKPVIGCEVYLAPDSRFNRAEVDGVKYFHLVLLAENNDGYKNLVKLVSLASIEGFYYKPRIDKDILKKYHEGLIALSACTAGEIPHAILQDKFSCAVELAQEYLNIFGRDNFFLEIQNHGLESEERVREGLKKISKQLGIGLVATNDVHYVRREDSQAHDILLCLQMNKTVSDQKRLKFSSDDYFLKSAEEMQELFADIPEALENTNKIAARCNMTFEFGKLQLPKYPLPENFTEQQYLRELCYKKISERYEVVTAEVETRLEYELKMIHRMGYDGYFLIVWDFINFARKNKIAVGPGRGSAAGSIVAYILGITGLDPLEYNLLFERFLNPKRVTMPDIDIDFCFVRREEVIDYVKNFYGEDHVAQIATFGTMAAKAAIRDVARVLDIPYAEGSRIIDMIPSELNMTLQGALNRSKDLRQEYQNNSEVRRIIDFAMKLEGIPRHFSVHAAGIVISKLPLTDYVPVQLSNGTLVTQYDKDKIEELGLLKMDFLGLRTLTILNETADNVKNFRGIEIDVEKIPLRDKLTAEMLSAGKTGAVFQMESLGMTNLVRDLKPESFLDLVPTVALYRPGPLGSGMVEDFIDGKHGLKTSTYLHPKLEPILRETFGVILYQEQVMQIVQALAGFTLGQADILRRAMGKKNATLLQAQKTNFLKGCAANGVDAGVAKKIFRLLEHFADYGFNKSHSAAYALLAWQTAYLKAHYPAEYMAAIMSSVMDSDKVSVYSELTRSMGIKLLPPDINVGGTHFQIENGAIRFSLSAIKNVGETVIGRVVKVRESGGKFKSLFDFCCRVEMSDFTRRGMENLIKSGAFDSVDGRRTFLIESLTAAYSVGQRWRKDFRRGQVGLFGEETQTINLKLPEVRERPRNELLAWEKEALGFYISGHPLDIFAEKMSGLTKIGDIKVGKVVSGKHVKIGGIITDTKRLTTKKGDLMAFATVEDFSDSIKVTIFPYVFHRCVNTILPEEVVIVSGKFERIGDSLQILADAVIVAENYMPDFYLTVTAQFENPETYDKLVEIFEMHKGGSQIFLRKSGKWTKLRHKKISDSAALRTELKNLLGEENVKIY